MVGIRIKRHDKISGESIFVGYIERGGTYETKKVFDVDDCGILYFVKRM